MEKAFELNSLVRENILRLRPYSSARDEFKGKEGVFLDANENPFGTLNRYPDPNQTALKTELALIKNVSVDNIFVGNGSDEAIDLVYRIFCNPGQDKVIVCPPTYGMYEVSAGINDVSMVKIPLDEQFQLDIERILKTEAKIIFICSPNNPTGNNLNQIEHIVERFKGIVFIDEAYIDFSNNDSFVCRINDYPNLIVSQTFSKARGLAAARVGMVFASTNIIRLFQKTKPPYNVSLLNQNAALSALIDRYDYEQKVAMIKSERSRLIDSIGKINFIKKVYPSDSNFILVEMENPTEVYDILASKQIVVRNRNNVVKGCLRITIGTQLENDLLLTELKEMDKCNRNKK